MKTTIMQHNRKRMSGWALCFGLCALLWGFACAQPSQAADASRPADRRLASDTRATQYNWKLARDYERQMRYELARQHYLLALASCRTEPAQTQLRRELEGVDLQIRTMR